MCKEKREFQFQTGSMCDAWKSLKTLVGQSKLKSDKSSMPSDKQKKFPDKLNDFYCRFDTQDFGTELARIRSELQPKLGEDVDLDDSDIDAKTLESIFRRLNTGKAIGPDNICGRLLKSCASQLSVVFSKLFTLSVKENAVPRLWKTSVICPVPKTRNPSSLKDHRPMALTPFVMKSFGRIILYRLVTHTKP